MYKGESTPNEDESPLAMSNSSKDHNSLSPSDFQRQAGSSHHCNHNEEIPSRRAPPGSFDFILAGDVLYKHTLLDPFLKTVDKMLASGGQLFLCHIPRAGVTYDEVEQAITRAGFRFRAVDSGEGCGLSAGETTTEVGGIELCVDDARRARLYAVSRIP